MSTRRSTCRCISSSAATITRRRRAVVPRPARRQAPAIAGRARDDVRLGQPPLDDLPGGAAEALSRNARRRWRPVAAACRRCRPSGSAFSTTRPRSMPPGTWSRTGPPRSARRCATMCRRLGFAATIRNRSMRELAAETLKLARAGLTRRQRLNWLGEDETQYLEPLDELVARNAHAGGSIAWRNTAALEGTRWIRCSAKSPTEFAPGDWRGNHEWPNPRPRPKRSKRPASLSPCMNMTTTRMRTRIGMQAAEALGITPAASLQDADGQGGRRDRLRAGAIRQGSEPEAPRGRCRRQGCRDAAAGRSRTHHRLSCRRHLAARSTQARQPPSSNRPHSRIRPCS